MTTPARITLSRAKGFNLQAASLALNGLPAVKVDRTTKFGNPWLVKEMANFLGELAVDNFPTNSPLVGFLKPTSILASSALSVALYRSALEASLASNDRRFGRNPERVAADIASLRGKNLACWCKQGQPCHADVLLEIANRPTCEEVM